ncbi:hypothetical protein RO3G_09175 [Rhizopus delemar RA 99-880]|uniref:Reverse transcriptase n=3 Tax=Rhizopus TaxID=4842 RepID=I1C7N5_RHIO9|nr:hypothetical protein RO3G_09175 [Rhizopus delemar RA 99-880]|eukprot:EIE84465.1 hypothetical protein RO3G_09175 [Rhizopus delemar RA 99-880]
MDSNNVNMQDLAQLIATAVASAINNKPENNQNSVRIPIPSTYSGERSAAVINLWIQEVERYLSFYSVHPNRWIAYAVTLLRGRSQKWWNHITQKQEEPQTWEKFKHDLEYAFKPSYSEQAARDRLANIKQTSSITEYADAFQDILLDLPRVSDDEALDRFVRGLKDKARIHVLTREPRSLEEAIRYSISYDSAQQAGIVLPQQVHEQFQNDPMDLSALMHQVNAIIRSNNNNNRYNQQDRRNTRFNKKNIICHWCSKPGHVVAECRTRLREVREFEQSKLKQSRFKGNQRSFGQNQVYHADLIEMDTSNNRTITKQTSDSSFFDSVNKDSLIDLSPYSFDFSNDRNFLMNATSRNSPLPTYEVFIQGQPYYALIDSGASANYIHPKVLKNADAFRSINNQAVETANGEQTMITGEATCTMKIEGEGKNFIDTFKAFVFESKFDIILGNEWLKRIKPKPDWFESAWSITLPDLSTVIMKPNDFKKFSKEFPDVFKGHISGLPPVRDTQEIIVTKPDAVPVSRPPYKMSPLELTELRKQLDELLQKGLIEPCASEWSNPVLFVRKPNGDLRMCCDYRMLNKVTLKQKIQLPRIDECLERLHKAKYFTSLDLTNGFHQQRLSETDSIKTAISTRYGQFCWKVVPFGLSNSGPAFQKMMNSILADYIDKFVMVYLDDILIFSTGDEEQHKKHVRLVLKKLDEAKLIINKKKCRFNRKELTFLGFNISAEGIKPAPEKVKAVFDWPTPTNVQQVRQFIGLAQHYRRFISGFAGIAAPLTNLTKGSGPKRRAITWTEDCQKSFDLIKRKLSSAPVLMTPDMTKPFRIECDASDFAIGAVLLQEEENGVWKPLAFESKKLSQAERNYPAQERELLSILHALRTWRCFIEGNEYQVFTDHLPLKYLRSQNKPTPRLVRWLSEIELYDPDILYKPGTENHVPDLLSRRDGVEAKPEKESMQPRYLYHISAAVKSLSILDQDPIQDWPLHYLSSPERWPNKIKNELDKLKHHFVIRDNQVYRKEKIPKNEDYVELKFIPFVRRADMVDNFHVGYGHSGQTNVYSLMKSRVWWPKMQNDINAWISKCPQCQLAGPADKIKHHAPMKPLEVPPAFSRWHLDFIGELPSTKNGNRWILMAVDYTTNWPIARALQNATGEEIVKFIYEEIVLRFGCPNEILTDRGANFMSKVVKQYISRIKTKHNLTSAFHPRSNGKCERLNQLFKKMLTKYVNGNVHSWDDYMDAALFACRIRKHATTGFSPFFLTYGVEPRIPGDHHRPFMNEFIEQDQEIMSQDVMVHLRKLREARYTAEDRLRKQAEIDKSRWDSLLKDKIQIFEIGDYVLLRHESKKGLEFNWMGPYKVIKRNLDFNTYQIQEINGKTYQSWVHTDRLHPVKYVGTSIDKSWYIPRMARIDTDAKLNNQH